MVNVGSVSVDVVGDVSRFGSRLRSDLLPEADRVGREIGKSLADSIAKGIKSGLGDGFTGAPAEASRKGRESGDSFAGEFARQVQTKIAAALKSLPKAEITADSSDAERKIAELRASLAELSEKRIGVDIDDAAALAEVDRIRAALAELARTSPDVKVRVDAGRAAAELDALKANLDKLDAQKVEVKVAAETAAAEAKLEAAKLKADELDRKKVKVKVDAETAAAEAKLASLGAAATGAAGGFNPLIAAGIALGPAIIPVAAAAVAAIAAIGTAAAGAAAGFGVAILAIKPVITAVTALAAADTSAAADAAAAASAAKAKANAIASGNAQVSSSEASLANARASAASGAVNAADRVKASETSLANARASAATAAINAADRVQASQTSLANTQASVASAAVNAADRVKAAEIALGNIRETVASAAVNAAQRVSDAQRGLADAQTQAALGVQTALGQVTSAERTLEQAQDAELAAQRALTDARKSAAQQLEDYQTRLADGALSQRAALLGIQKAKENLDKVNATAGSTQLQRAEAQLAYDQAVQHNTDLGIQQQRLKASAAEATKAGVEGSKQVVAAKDRVTQANENITAAQAGLAKAEAGVAAARAKGAEQVAKAQEAIGTAQRAQADQARAGAAQILTAQQAIANAQRTQADQARQGAAQILTAEQGVANARRAQADQARQGAASIVTAQDAVASSQRAQADQARQGAASIAAAQQSVANAQRSLAAAYAQTTTAGLSTANKLDQAFQGLSTTGAGFARFIYGLKDEFQGLSKAAQDGLLPGLQTLIEALLPSLPALTRFVGSLASVMGDLFVEASKALTGPFWTQFFEFISGNAAGWLRTFAETFGQLVKGAAGLFQALSPVADLFNGYLLAGATAFANWATSLGQNTGFQTFLGYIKDNLPLVLTFLGDLGRLVGNILIALAPLGPVILKVVDAVVKFLANLDPHTLLLFIGAIGGAYLAITTLGPVIGIIIKALKLFGITSLGVAGAIIGGLLLLAAGFVYLWQTNETFRDKVTNAFISIRAIVFNAWQNYIKPALEAMWVFIRDTLIPVFQQVWAVIEDAWTKHIQPALQALAAFIMERVVPAVRGIIDAIKGFLDVAIPIVIQFVEGMRARIEPLMPQIKAIFGQIGDIIVGALDLIKAVIERVTAVISWIWTNWGQGIMDWIGVVFRAVIGIVGPALEVVKSVIKFFTDILHGNWSAAWQDVKDILSHSWDLIKGIIGGALDIVKQVLSTAWSVIKTVAEGAWKGVTDTIGAAWEWIKGIIAGALFAAYAEITARFHSIEAFTQTIWNAIVDGITGIWDRFVRGFQKSVSDVGTFLSETWTRIQTGAEKTWGQIVDGIGTIWNTVIDKIKGPLNTILDFIEKYFVKPLNAMLGAVGIDPNAFKIPDIPQFADGGLASIPTGAARHAGGGTVGGYSPHDRADNIPAWLTAEEFILPVAATRALRADGGDALLERLRTWNIGAHADGGLVRGYADGGSVWDAIKAGIGIGAGVTPVGSAISAASDIGGFLSDPIGKFKELVGQLLSSIGSGVFPEIAKGALSKVGDGLAEKVKSLLAAVTGTSAPTGAGGGTAVPVGGQGPAAFEGWWSQAVGINSALAPYHAAAVTTARNESGFNPSIVNHWDSNAQKGTPSAGLMQFIESTFRANEWPGYTNWLGAVDQILAWKTYADRQYGGPNNIPGVRGVASGSGYVGYGDGGEVLKPILLDQLGIKMPVFDTGGTLMPGPNLVYNGTGGPEDLDRRGHGGDPISQATIMRIAAAMADVTVRTSVTASTFDHAMGALL